MTNEDKTTVVTGSTANVDGSGQGSGEGATGDGKGAQGDLGAGDGAAGAGGEGEGTTAGTEGTEGEGDKSKPEGAEGTEGKADEGKGETALELNIPEGIEVTPEWRTEIESLATTLEGMTPTQRAQAIVDAGVKFQAQLTERSTTAANDLVATWAEQAKADPVIGGASYEANVMIAQKAFVDYGDPELKQVLIDSGLGNHPALLRWAYKVGKASAESRSVHGLGESPVAAPVNSEAAMAARMKAAAAVPSKKRE